jgi:hypothetical protein
MTTKHWYLVSVQLSAGSGPLIERLKQDLPIIEATLKELSDNQYRLLLRSDTRQTSTWILHTSINSKQISSRIQNPKGTALDIYNLGKHGPDSARRDDKIVVLQLGDDRCITGLNVIQTWLDRAWNSD